MRRRKGEAHPHDLVVFLDSDLSGDVTHYVPGLLVPLLDDPQVLYVKGCYTRPLEMGGQVQPAGGGRVTRVHGPFVSDEEVERVVSFLKEHAEPDYIDEITEDDSAAIGDSLVDDEGGSGDGLYYQAVALVCR